MAAQDEIVAMSPDDGRKIKEMYDWYMRIRGSVGTEPEQEYRGHPAPECYIARLPAAGIPALTVSITSDPDTAGSATCDIYRAFLNGANWEITEIVDLEKTVLNVGLTIVTGRYAIVHRNKGGQWTISTQGSIYWHGLTSSITLTDTTEVQRTLSTLKSTQGFALSDVNKQLDLTYSGDYEVQISGIFYGTLVPLQQVLSAGTRLQAYYDSGFGATWNNISDADVNCEVAYTDPVIEGTLRFEPHRTRIVTLTAGQPLRLSSNLGSVDSCDVASIAYLTLKKLN